MMATPVLVRGFSCYSIQSHLLYCHPPSSPSRTCLSFFLFYTRVNLFFLLFYTIFLIFFCTVHIFFLLWSSSINIIYIYIDYRVGYFFFFLYFRIDSFHCYSLRSIEVEHEWCVPPPPFFKMSHCVWFCPFDLKELFFRIGIS